MWVMGGGEETPPSAVRPRGKGVPPSMALDISGSPHLTIGYLQKGMSGMYEYEGLATKLRAWRLVWRGNHVHVGVCAGLALVTLARVAKF